MRLTMKRLVLLRPAAFLVAAMLAMSLCDNAQAREPLDTGVNFGLDLEEPVLFLSQLDGVATADIDDRGDGFETFTRQTKSVGWELGGLVAGVTALGGL